MLVYITTAQYKNLFRFFWRGESVVSPTRHRSSFTLIELLIVIGILAVLVAAIVITLNPAQLLAQARDSKRQQDLSALTQALNTITTLDQSLFMGTSSIVYTSLPDSSSTCGSWGLPTLPSGWQYHCSPTSSLQSATGTGWIPVNFKTTGVVSLSSLPTDPINASSSNLYYTYVSGGSFELNGILESTKYRSNPSLSKPNLPGVLSYGSNQALSPLYNTSGLVGYWNFDEGSGTIAKDTSGNGRNGTLVNFLFSGESNWVVGKVGGGLSFNGINNYVDTSNFFDNPSSFTVALWFKVGSKHGFSNLVTKLSDWGSGAGWSAVDNYGNGEISMLYQQNGGSVYVQKGIDPAYQPTDGGWHLLGVALSSQLFTFYLDGRAVTSSDQGSVGYPSSVTNTTNVRMGTTGNFTPSSSYASGTFDDVRLYNRALSSSEMMALYNAEK